MTRLGSAQRELDEAEAAEQLAARAADAATPGGLHGDPATLSGIRRSGGQRQDARRFAAYDAHARAVTRVADARRDRNRAEAAEARTARDAAAHRDIGSLAPGDRGADPERLVHRGSGQQEVGLSGDRVLVDRPGAVREDPRDLACSCSGDRGMSADRIEVPIGRLAPFSEPGSQRLLYANEYDLRDGLAALAWVHGWDVATEVTTGTGTRADVVLTTPGGIMIPIELKVELKTQRNVRHAFQQADGYHRHFSRISEGGTVTFLSAVEIDRTVTRPFEDLYPQVKVRSFDLLLHIIRGLEWTNYSGPGERAKVAAERRQQAEEVARFIRTERMDLALARRERFLHDLAFNYRAAATTLLAATA